MAETKAKRSVAILLSGREKFSPYYGGALARWTFEVYSRLTTQFDCSVFGFPTKQSDLYPLPHQTSGAWRWCDLLARIPRVRRHEEQFWLRALLGRLRQFDAIHIHNRPQWVSFLRSFGYRGRLVLHLQNDHLGHWAGPALDTLAPKLDRLIVCSHYLRSTFAGRSSILAAKTEVVFNGVNMDLFHPQEYAREAKTIFFVGRFDQEKGVLQLVQAYARVLQRHPAAQLVIGGTTGFGVHKETPYVQEVRRLAASLLEEKHANIQFTGYLHHDQDLPKWFQRAAIFASPSIFQEPFGLVNAEAMACATPVVGANRGGIPEVLGATGCLVDPENIDQFAEAISKLLGESDYRARLGCLAYKRCRELFDWSVIASHWGRLL
jgi:spore coat protein SA